MLVPRESLVTLDLKDHLDLRVRRAREDPMVRSETMDPLAAVELEVLLAAVECLDLREELAHLVCLVLVAPPV